MEDKWTIEVSYVQLLLLKSALTNYTPSGTFFTAIDKEETLKQINDAK